MKQFRRAYLALVAATLPAIGSTQDGILDAGYGVDGRNATGYLESDSVQLRDIARYAPNGRLWKFGDDRNDPTTVYLARALDDGQPDAGFGPNGDGRRRTALPAGIVAQPHALDLVGGIVQADGKPVIYGGLRARNGSVGAFPGLVCRFAAAGNLDAGFGDAGCRTLRSFLSANETCRVTDVALAPGDQLVAVGNCRAPDLVERPFITRLTANGAPDLEFGAGLGLVAPPLSVPQASAQSFAAVTVRPDGLILVLGELVRSFTGGLRRDLALTRFDGGGSLDPQFGSGGVRVIDFANFGFPDARARDLALRDDGAAIALGDTVSSGDRMYALLAGVDALGDPLPGFGSIGQTGQQIDLLASIADAESRLARLQLDSQGRAFVAGALVDGRPDARAHAGTDFWFQLAAAVPPASDVRVRIAGDVATSGLITSPFQDTSIPFQVQPGAITEVVLSRFFTLEGIPQAVNPIAIRVTADAPVVVNAFSGRPFTTSSTALLPVEQLGREYRVHTWGPNLGVGSHLIVIAALPGSTAVTVRAPVAAGGVAAGTPIQVLLQQGESFHLKTDDGEADLTGATVSADRPVAVFGANSCAMVPNGLVDFCDQTSEQMEPLERWGSDFVVVPFAGRSGDVVSVLAHESGTAVEVDGDVVATLAAGDSYVFARSTPARVRTSRPASLAQFEKGCVVDQVGDTCVGDPSMLAVPPRSRWGLRHIAIHPTFAMSDIQQASTRRYLGIVAPLDAVGSVTLDGAPVPAAAFSPVGDGRHAHAQLERPAGVDVVAAPVPIYVSVYGRANGEAWAMQAAHAPLGGDEATADDLVLRFGADGTRDPDFGIDGIAILDHAPAYGTALASFDGAVRAIPAGASVYVGSASRNRASGQSYLLDYRLDSASLFRDGFESQ
jgi:uncharacterized delta-60 repeat protein